MTRILKIIAVAVLCSGSLISFAHSQDKLTATDGDSIRNGEERIRVMGYDAPELMFHRCEAERVAGEAAKRKLQDLLDDGPVRIEREGLDKYRRRLAKVYVGDVDVAQTMVEEQLAMVYTCGTNNRCPRRIDWCKVPQGKRGILNEDSRDED